MTDSEEEPEVKVAKAQRPLKILVVGDQAQDIMDTDAIKHLQQRGDLVVLVAPQHHINDYDVVLGGNALRAFPSIMKHTVLAVEAIRKTKPKPPPKPKPVKKKKAVQKDKT
jgi:fructoselysine-6-P-deglycase FrlB-like protein